MKKGFSLIESIIYISLSSMIFLVFINFIDSFKKNSNKNVLKTQKYLESIVGFMYFLNDLKRASSGLDQWPKYRSSELIYSTNGIEYGWFLSSSKLVRYSGTYDKKNGVWKKKVPSLVINDVSKLSLSYIKKDKSIKAIKSLMEFDGLKNFKLEGFVALSVCELV